jgi:hypothetical protein
VTSAPPATTLRTLQVGTALAVDFVTAEVVGALRAAGVRSILLRGPAIMRWLYGEGEPRPYRDIDLLVDPAARADAEAVLGGLGFIHRQAGFAANESVQHAGEWFRDRPAVVVDLHRGLEGAAAEPSTLWSALARRTEELEVGGTLVEAPDQPTLALVVTLHAAHHGVEGEKQLAELLRAMRTARLDTWAQAARLAQEIGAVPAFAAGLRLLPEGADVAERLGLSHDATPETVLRASSAHSTAIGFARLAATPGLRARAVVVARKAVPTRAFMRYWSPLARRGPAGMALAYLWRPLWLTWRLVPAARAWGRARR